MTTARTPEAYDEGQANRFAERMSNMLNAGAAACMVSIGHRLGLFDVLTGMPSATSTAIADAAGLAERYVREWLAVMVVARIVDYDPATSGYRLPAEHSACLTRDAALGNLAVYAQHVALFGKIEDRVLECFRSGEGMGYHEYPSFHQLMAEDSAQTVTAGLFDHILPLVPGLDVRLERGIDVLDAGCGRGSALIALATRYPESRFTGYDLCADAIAHATQCAAQARLGNLRFETRDLTGYVAAHTWDLITTFDAVHDQKDPAALLRGLHDSLKPDGVYLMQDIGGSAHLQNNVDFPMAAFLYTASCVHCTPVSIAQGGAGLGTMWGWETAQRLLAKAGFQAVERHVLPHDPMNVWFVCRP